MSALRSAASDAQRFLYPKSDQKQKLFRDFPTSSHRSGRMLRAEYARRAAPP
jgi:hypothetical protein